MLIAFALAALTVSHDPDGVVTTAPRGADSVLVGAVAPAAEVPAGAHQTAVTPHNLTTQQQIDRWLSARNVEAQPFEEATVPMDDRQVHGFVSGSIGTNDFSNVSVGVSLPLGENGRIDLSYSETKNGYGYGYGYPRYGYGFADGYGYDGLVDHSPSFGRYGRFHGANSDRSERSFGLRIGFDDDKDRERRGSPRGRGVIAD